MPVMTQELQDAYTEWLLLWGYREVSMAEVHSQKPMFYTAVIAVIAARDAWIDAWIDAWDANINTNRKNNTYQLKAPEKLTNNS